MNAIDQYNAALRLQEYLLSNVEQPSDPKNSVTINIAWHTFEGVAVQGVEIIIEMLGHQKRMEFPYFANHDDALQDFFEEMVRQYKALIFVINLRKKELGGGAN